MDRRLFTSGEVAELLRTSRGQLANMRMRGSGPPYLKFDRRVLYDKEALEVWLNSHKIKTEPK